LVVQTEPRTDELAKTYDPSAVEARRYAEWLAARVFHDEPDPARPPFIISMPPPNITGRAHLGTASTYHADGRPHALPSNARRERGLAAGARSRRDRNRSRPRARTRERRPDARPRSAARSSSNARGQWRDEYGGAIQRTVSHARLRPDWDRDRFTLDPGLSAAVVKVFVALYREGLIYRGTRLVNWDPESQSTLSDAEVDDEERDGFLWQIRYAAPDGSFSIEVATTRPETMLGDTAVAVHPERRTLRALVGKSVVLPLVGRAIPIVADSAVERDFGTGAVKVTPAHDPLDNEIGERHGLPMPSVIGFDGKMTEEAPPPTAARPLRSAQGRRARPRSRRGARHPTPRRHVVPISSRSGAIVEPLLSLQWFCKMETLAAPALEAYRAAAFASCPNASAAPTRAGSRTSAIGTSRVRFGGATACPFGTSPTTNHRRRNRRRSARARAARPIGTTDCGATPTRSTPGSRAASGRSRFSAGPRRRPNSNTGIRIK
jgi:valyl-tRNA synthetase